jgi:ABC-type transport system involved in multi-copper enzyme maturation permease subunit
MGTLRLICHLTRADFLERVRRFSFLIVLALVVGAGYLFVPPVDAGYRVLQLGVYRGIYNSAWIGLMFGLIAALHLPLAGFFLVKNAVEHDRRTGVGEIIATSPISKFVYIVGKWLSNLAILILILSIMTVMAIVMQIIRAEDTALILWALVTPIWLMGLPVLAIAAALAVLFESVSFLRGSLGNVAIFFLWLFAIAIVLSGAIDDETGLAQRKNDLYGYTNQLADIQRQVLTIDPEAEVGSSLINAGRDVEHTFVWDGIHWQASVILERVMWAGLAVVFALAASILFDRFNPAPVRIRRVFRPGFLILAFVVALTLLIPDLPIIERVCWISVALISLMIAFLPDRYMKAVRKFIGLKDKETPIAEGESRARQEKSKISTEFMPLQSHDVKQPGEGVLSNVLAQPVSSDLNSSHRNRISQNELIAGIKVPRVISSNLARLDAIPFIQKNLTRRDAPPGRIYAIILAECRLILKEQRWIFWVGAIMLNIACLLSPEEIIRRFLFPALWCWPVFLWSQMGVREDRYSTGEMVFSSPKPVWRQLPAVWVAGVTLTFTLGIGGWMRLLMMGEILQLLAWFVGVLFVPALALVMGVWTRHSRFFEITYLLLWYVGPFEGVPSFDFAGITSEAITRGIPWVYLTLAILLFGIALIGRTKRLK